MGRLPPCPMGFSRASRATAGGQRASGPHGWSQSQPQWGEGAIVAWTLPTSPSCSLQGRGRCGGGVRSPDHSRQSGDSTQACCCSSRGLSRAGAGGGGEGGRQCAVTFAGAWGMPAFIPSSEVCGGAEAAVGILPAAATLWCRQFWVRARLLEQGIDESWAREGEEQELAPLAAPLPPQLASMQGRGAFPR
jgi:hypothetical protein